jgi:nucleolar pre-ribosomal-associated protein 2
MLNERNFMTILRQALEEAQKQKAVSNERVAKDTSEVGAGSEGRSLKVSKKRKRSGELISAGNDSRENGQKLPAAIFAAIYHMLRLTKVTSKISDGGRTTAFSTEYLKSVIRTPAEEAAKILGAWLSLCRILLRERQTLDPDTMMFWLSPFIEIWDSRVVGNEDFMQFSLHCSQPLLSLYKVMKGGETPSNWMDEMEQLAARNIMIPAKAAKLGNADSDLLNTLTRISVIQESANAPILFRVAIRSIQAQGSRLRRLNDESWLRTVFTALKDAMPSQRAEENANAIQAMLQSANKYKVVLELSKLRLLASEYCLFQGSTNWELLATIIKLDANVFLISDDHKDLVQLILTRITAACLEPTWSELSVQVISEVVVPLMNGFAKARDLSTFIRHWHGQLVEFEKLRKERPSVSIEFFSAWEDDLLQAEFSKIMEASLTVLQISQLLDWLSSQVTENLDATCLILEAVVGSITDEEVVDAVGLRPFQIMFDKGTSGKLDERYKWRSWRVISRSLKWITRSGHEELSVLWEEGGVPFNNLSDKLCNGSLLNLGNTMELETLEILRCACAAFNAPQAGTTLYHLARNPVLDALHSLSQDFKLLLKALTGDMDLDKEGYGSPPNTLRRGLCPMLWSSIFCVLVEFPRLLV